jgi:hypothetical protein
MSPMIKLCGKCETNLHRDCDLHRNDGSVGAEEFVGVRCDCACEGQVYAEPGKRLIDLVARLRRQLEDDADAHSNALRAQIVARRAAQIALAAAEANLDAMIDDEGDVIASRRPVKAKPAASKRSAAARALAAPADSGPADDPHPVSTADVAVLPVRGTDADPRIDAIRAALRF